VFSTSPSAKTITQRVGIIESIATPRIK
jgi:hypothetical protein